ncbi:alpha/beta-hydrolase [Amniculicola lignicola CBS 123094]|uniref:Carboxylic ester hydrolase n=1 Tax=Amniculicola lignicola CBS 123094 TaxID=1392246 RepID=A0A6A5WKB7_9PLEO|nr:alpha/beta-hydrolase [Amniculicola lignicola CBS 123094]
MFLSIGLATAALLCRVCPVVAVPSPQSIGSDLTILTHNDLYGNATSRPATVIALSARQTHEEAIFSCAALGENLWNPDGSLKELGFLRYLDHGKVTDDVGVYWVGSSSGCRTIDTHGTVHEDLSCDTYYPVLCSQSARLSSQTSIDISPRWQTAVTTKEQTYVGYRDQLSFRFLGIRYAARPARFGYSKYQAPSSLGNFTALSYGPDCIQQSCKQQQQTCSEDCHFLNIWTPHLPNQKNLSKKKPVMLWIHGGGFGTGSGSDTTFDGGNLASRGDVVVVTINYRLSTLGFLALSNTTLKGNYGLVDQFTALEWVRAHIQEFGGDKDRITLFGQSAGAASVRALLASSQARGKVSGAILQSNPGGLQWATDYSRYLTIEQATNRTKSILTELDCTQTDQAIQLACLRAQDPFRLIGDRNGIRFPVVDGTYLTSNELSLDKAAARHNVNLMTGVMRDDGAPYSSLKGSSNATKALLEQGFANPSSILESKSFPFPTGSNGTMNTFNLTSRVWTDATFRCLTQSTAIAAVKNVIFPVVYSYEFHRGYQISEWSPNPPTCDAPVTSTSPYGDPSQEYFKCHSGELYYVFGSFLRQGRQQRDGHDVSFSQYIVDSWTAFARSGNPNPAPEFLTARGFSNTSTIIEKAGLWKPVEAKNPALRVLDTRVRDEGFKEVEQCAVLGLPLDYYLK